MVATLLALAVAIKFIDVIEVNGRNSCCYFAGASY